MSETRKSLIEHAKLAEQVERYDDMAANMKKVVEMTPVLSEEERRLLAVAYQKVIERRLIAWRILKGIGQKTEACEEKQQMAKAYCEKVEDELKSILFGDLHLLTKFLIPNAANPASEVYYLHMKEKYCGYFAEVAPGDFAEFLASAEGSSGPENNSSVAENTDNDVQRTTKKIYQLEVELANVKAQLTQQTDLANSSKLNVNRLEDDILALMQEQQDVSVATEESMDKLFEAENTIKELETDLANAKHQLNQQKNVADGSNLLGFFIFSQDKRVEVQQSFPEWQLIEVGEELVHQWEVLPEETRQTYAQTGVGDVRSEHQAQDKLSGDQKEGCPANCCLEMDEIPPGTEVYTSAENKKTD